MVPGNALLHLCAFHSSLCNCHRLLARSESLLRSPDRSANLLHIIQLKRKPIAGIHFEILKGLFSGMTYASSTLGINMDIFQWELRKRRIGSRIF